MKNFDIHSHLHSNFFQDDIGPILKEMREKEIGTIAVGVSLVDSEKALLLAGENENVWATIGIHPTEQEEFVAEKFQKLLDKNKEKIVGIGECGLDYYWLARDLKTGKINEVELELEKKRQKKLFSAQIKFAQKNNLPLMLHVRAHQNADAYWDIFKILDNFFEKQKIRGLPLQGEKMKINFHFFTETPKIAREILKRGWNISFPGVITFADLDETIQAVPLEKIMAETDSPFAAPVPYRGQTNTSLFIPEIVKKIAEVKNIPLEECQQQLLKNTQNFWGV